MQRLSLAKTKDTIEKNNHDWELRSSALLILWLQCSCHVWHVFPSEFLPCKPKSVQNIDECKPFLSKIFLALITFE